MMMGRVASGVSIALGIALFAWVFAIGSVQARECQAELGNALIWGAVDPKVLFLSDPNGFSAWAGCAYDTVHVLDLSGLGLNELPTAAVLEEFTNLQTLRLSDNEVRDLALYSCKALTPFLTRMCSVIHSSRTSPSPSRCCQISRSSS